MEAEDLTSITGGPLKPHEYVLVKSRQTAGDVRYIQNHSAKTRRGTNNDDMEVVMTLGDTQFATFQRMVKGWNLTRAVPIDGIKKDIPIPFMPDRLEQCIESLDGKVYTYVLQKMQELYGTGEDSESDANFQPAVVDSSEASLDAERMLRLKP